MKDHVASLNYRASRVQIAQVDLRNLDERLHLLQIRPLARREIVNDDDTLSAIPQQSPHEGRPDEAGASGHRIRFVHAASLSISASRYRNDSVARFSAPKSKSNASCESSIVWMAGLPISRTYFDASSSVSRTSVCAGDKGSMRIFTPRCSACS